MALGQSVNPLESTDGTQVTVRGSGDGTTTVILVDAAKPLPVRSKAAFLEQIGVTRRRNKIFGKGRVF